PPRPGPPELRPRQHPRWRGSDRIVPSTRIPFLQALHSGGAVCAESSASPYRAPGLAPPALLPPPKGRGRWWKSTVPFLTFSPSLKCACVTTPVTWLFTETVE